MFSKFQDFLLVVVLFYSIYRIGFGEGVTTVNLFILLCAVVAVISMALKRSGAYDRAHKQREEAMKKKEENKERNAFSEKHIGWNENDPGQTAGSEEETPWQ